MRYLITVSSLTKGSGLSRYVFSLCRLLVEAGNEVWVLTTHDEGTISYERTELDLTSKEIRLVSLGIHNKFTKYLQAVRWIRHIKPDVIINNYNAVVQYILPFISRRIKVVHVLHNDTDDFYRVASINGVKTDGWVAPTQSIATHFNDYTSNKYASRVKVIPHGVEESEIMPKKNEMLEIVYAGVLYEHKGVKILPEVIKRLRKKDINLHFTIVGGGILDEWLREQFADEVRDGVVTFTGVIAHDKVYEVMSSGDIFLYPTHLDAFGLVIAEAMMNGLVPVVTHLPGITDNLITHGVDGFLLKQDDINAFVDSIVQLARDIHIREGLQIAAHNKAKSSLSMSVMNQNYNKYLSSI